MIIRKWLVVARGYGEVEPCLRLPSGRLARFCAKRWNRNGDDDGWIYTVERVTRPCKTPREHGWVDS